MKIVTRGKGIPEYTIKKGIMRIDSEPSKDEKFWIKMDTESNEQYIVEFNEWELAKLSAFALQDKKIREAISRYPNAEKFLKK